MKIRRVTFDGLEGVPDGSFSFFDPGTAAPHPVTAITGPMGSGKTRFLEALALAKEDVGPYTFRPRGDGWIRAGSDTAKISVEWQLTEEEVRATGATGNVIESETVLGQKAAGFPDHDDALSVILSRYDHLPTVGKLEYFPANRSIPRGGYGSFARPLDDEASRRSRLTSPPDKYSVVRQFLVELSVGLHERSTEPEQLGAKRFRDAFAALCTTKRFEGINRGKGGIRVLFSDALGATYDLDLLSDGERQAALFAATFVHIDLSQSVVFIDRPELHLADDEVPAFVRALSGLGRDNQLILATSSSILAKSLGTAVVRLGQGARRLT